MKKTKIVLGVSILFMAFACEFVQTYEPLIIECETPQLSQTISISTLKSMYSFGSPRLIKSDEIIEGYVVSDDKSGNIYKTLYIQDAPKNPTAAIRILVDETSLSSKFNFGRKIYVKLKGLAIGYSYGSIQLGKSQNNGLGAIGSSEIENHLIRTCDVFDIEPKEIHISDIDESMYGMLLKINNVQFSELDKGQPYANPSTNENVERLLQEFNQDCELKGEVVLKTSGFSNFKNQQTSEGKGHIIALCGNYFDSIELYLNSNDGINFNSNRCNYTSAFDVNTSIGDLKLLYNGGRIEFGAGEPLVLAGYVISNDESGNFQNKLIIQDEVENPEGGLQILLEESDIYERYYVGDKVLLRLNRLYMDKHNGILSIGIAKGNSIGKIGIEDEKRHLFNSRENFQIVPKELELSAANELSYRGTLVKIVDVELIENELGKAFTYFSGNEDGIRTLISCEYFEKIGVFTSGTASFAHTEFPKGKGWIVGVLGTYLEMRSNSDISLSQAYEHCIIEQPKILITEVADPKNSTSSRFVELYNAGESDFLLSGWKLNKYINGSYSVSGGAVVLENITIPSKGYLVLANSGYKDMFGNFPDVESNYISGNGDDVYELIDNSGETIDIYGVIGTDGNGTNWEYLDGKAVRKLSISSPNPIFVKEEWTVYSMSNNALIDFPGTGQNAPLNFNPRER